jgi:hypothetical protein
LGVRSFLSGKIVEQEMDIVEKRETSESLTAASDKRLAKILSAYNYKTVEVLKNPLESRGVWKTEKGNIRTYKRQRRLKVFTSFQQQSMNGTKTKLQYIASQRKQCRYHVITPKDQPFIKDSDLGGGENMEHKLADYIRAVIQKEAKRVTQFYSDNKFLTMLFRSTEVTFVRSTDLLGNDGWFINLHFNILVDSKFSQKYKTFLDDAQNKFKSFRDAGRLKNVNEITKYVTKPGELMNLCDDMLHIWSLAICGSTLDENFKGRSLRFYAFGHTVENKYLKSQREKHGKKPVIDFIDGEPELILHKINQFTERNGSGCEDPINIILAATPPILEEISRTSKSVKYLYNPRWLFMGGIDERSLHTRIVNKKKRISFFGNTLIEQIDAGFKNGMAFENLEDWVQQLVISSPILRALYLGQKTANSLLDDRTNSEVGVDPPPSGDETRKYTLVKNRKQSLLFA